MVTLDEYRQIEARNMPEKTLQTRVELHARQFGWLCYHTHDSRRSQPGWPDVFLTHPHTGKIIVRELKTMTGRVTKAQREWLDALGNAGLDTGVWRPIDLLTGDILRTLEVPHARTRA